MASTACIAHLRLALRHRRIIRITNLLERLVLDEPCRTKIIPHAFGRVAGLEAHVRGRDPSHRPLARHPGRRVRAAPVARDSRGTRPRRTLRGSRLSSRARHRLSTEGFGSEVIGDVTKLILVEGFPGSGKSTTAQWLAASGNSLGAPV